MGCAFKFQDRFELQISLPSTSTSTSIVLFITEYRSESRLVFEVFFLSLFSLHWPDGGLYFFTGMTESSGSCDGD